MKIQCLSHVNTEPIDQKIKDILARGKTVCFTNVKTGVIKHVTEWNLDQDGDLTASYSTGATKYVCPYAVEYEISELEK